MTDLPDCGSAVALFRGLDRLERDESGSEDVGDWMGVE
jgi:hypothetical protein